MTTEHYMEKVQNRHKQPNRTDRVIVFQAVAAISTFLSSLICSCSKQERRQRGVWGALGKLVAVDWGLCFPALHLDHHWY